MSSIAVLFPGQGAQYLGMAKDFIQQDAHAKQVFEIAEQQLGINLSHLMFEENDLLSQTEYTQKAIFVASTAIFRTVKSRLRREISAMIGFSLGEYTALHASGVFTLETAIDLIEKRSRWMEEATHFHPGAMAALIGGNLEQIQQFCEETTKTIGLLTIANYNSPLQKVLSGTPEAIQHLMTHFSSLGAKRCVQLNVSGAFHSPLMHTAATKMKEYIESVPQGVASTRVIANATGTDYDWNNLAHTMEQQIESSVLFEKSIRLLYDQGFDTFIEVGPGQVLTGLVKKTLPDARTISIDQWQDLVKLEELS